MQQAANESGISLNDGVYDWSLILTGQNVCDSDVLFAPDNPAANFRFNDYGEVKEVITKIYTKMHEMQQRAPQNNQHFVHGTRMEENK